MKTIPSFVLILMFSMTICIGCSVKEDRRDCPCTLTLDFSEKQNNAPKLADLIISTNGGIFLSKQLDSTDLDDKYILKIPRDIYQIGIWGGTETTESKGGFKIPYGEDCPKVYMHVSQIQANQDEITVQATPKKNHSVLVIEINQGNDAVNGIILTGNVDGYNPDGTPRKGLFHHIMQNDNENVYTATLPRQVDDSLTLYVQDDYGYEIKLGKMIIENGFDWSKEELDDIHIELDTTNKTITFPVQSWNEGNRLDVTI